MHNLTCQAQSDSPKAPSSGTWAARLIRIRPAILFLAFFALSLNMRSALTSLPPIIHEICQALDISAGLAGGLTSVPVFCFGFLSPVAGLFIKRLGLDTSVFVTLAGILAGCLVRAAGGFGAAFAGTLIMGMALTIGNTAGLMVIQRDFPSRTGIMTGIYVSGMSLGSMFVTALTAPVAHMAGWRAALAFPAFIAMSGVIMWFFKAYTDKKILPAAPRAEINKTDNPKSPETGIRFILKQPVVWLISVAFAAHTFLFFGLTAWLPAYLIQTLGMSSQAAGGAASMFQIFGLVGCFGLPVMASTRRFSNRCMFLVVTISWILTAAGYWLAPSQWLIWTFFGGIGSGGGFTVVFGLVMTLASNIDENRNISTMVQSVGYMVASASPFIIGHIHEQTGQWGICMAILTSAGLVMTLCGIFATAKIR